MKYFNYDLIKEIIESKKETLLESSIGMHEDWFWTGQDIWKSGKYTVKMPTNKRASTLRKEYRKLRESGVSLFDDRMKKYNTVATVGAGGSTWATPVIHLEYIDGADEYLDVSIGESEKQGPGIIALGCLSGPAQENIKPITKS